MLRRENIPHNHIWDSVAASKAEPAWVTHGETAGEDQDPLRPLYKEKTH